MANSLIQLARPLLSDGEHLLTGTFTPPAAPVHQLEFRFTPPQSGDALTPQARPFLFAFLLPAMRVGAPLQLDAPLDPTTLANVMEWQEAMAAWHPQTLRVVPIQCEVAPAESPRSPDNDGGGALTAFSGGVDSCFTATRHSAPSEPAAYRRTNLRAGMMVHGLDIPLDQPETFESAWQNSRAILAGFGLKAYRLRTDIRLLQHAFGCRWETEAHGIWLAATLACYEPWFDRILIPSTYVYAKLKLPWGSNPVTDPLFSAERVDYWHDGAAHTKLVKVRAIARHPVVQQRVRVCWQGPALDRNCGRCFKCIATQVCFWLSGVERPDAFPAPCSLDHVARMPVKNEPNAFLLRALRDEARRQARRSLAHALDRALLRGACVRATTDLKARARIFLRS